MIRTACKVLLLSLSLGLCLTGLARADILPKSGEAQYELEFWDSIKNSTHAEDYEAYLKAYPHGHFAPLARIRAARYAKPAPPVAEPPPPVEEMDVQYEAVTSANVRKEPFSRADRVGYLERELLVCHDKRWGADHHGGAEQPDGYGFRFLHLWRGDQTRI